MKYKYFFKNTVLKLAVGNQSMAEKSFFTSGKI